jgi:hypothetical protein
VENLAFHVRAAKRASGLTFGRAVQSSICITPEEMALIQSAILAASRLAMDKLPPAQWEQAQLALNHASMSLAHGKIDPNVIDTVCGCVENVRRMLAHDVLIPREQRLLVVKKCEDIITKFDRALDKVPVIFSAAH